MASTKTEMRLRSGRSLKLALVAAAATAGLASGTAFAQSSTLTPDTPQPAQQGAPVPATAALTHPSNSTALNEVVVTATKLGPDLSRAPVAVTSLNSADLERDRIQSVADVSQVIPSLVYNNPTGAAQAFIRGIGSNFVLGGLEPAVATYEDGVYLERQIGSTLDVSDLSNIEVLRGPQGTLFGRNATGGAIVIQTADPTQTFGGYVDGEYGEYGHLKGEAVLNIPLTDTLAVRLAGQSFNDGGYVHSTIPGVGDIGAVQGGLFRFKIKWSPSPNFSAIYTLEDYVARENLYAEHERLPAPQCLVCGIYGIQPPSGFYVASQSETPKDTVNYLSHVLRLNARVGDFDITDVTSVRNTNTAEHNDEDYLQPEFFTASPGREQGPTIYEDIFARSRYSGPINFLAGFTYENDYENFYQHLGGAQFAPLTTAAATNIISLQSYSAYAEVYYQFTQALKLTLGMRYSSAHKSIRGYNNPEAQLIFKTPGFQESATYPEYTPRAVLSYDIGERGYYYVSYNRGEKSGGFSTPAFTTPFNLQPETLDEFEIGAKNHFLNNRIRTTADFFYGLYDNVQVQYINAAAGTVEAQNAASARTYGLEGDVQWAVTSDFHLSAGADYLHNTFSSYPNAAVFAYEPTVSPVGLTSTTENLAGANLPRSPHFSADITGDYMLHPTFLWGWTIDAAVTARYTSRFDFLAGGGGPLDQDVQGAFTKMDGTLTFASPSKQTSVGIFADNLTSAEYLNYSTTSNYGSIYVPARPRVVGVRLKQAF